ncbi:hypothetical protein DFJ58DRAFT_731459 [Suillus subalutaceus]|uniref:uncharacterized protein n=1 Tax=Suillus subalutaceus TaxID=48586 RepID=UPI001B884BC9|nr:uncharacterized protein DFJ58DRAFT_731459 [Suillus subalutaceus]KAG1843785.1 hypothetical protein DFJ58DRAFT_731459 [Suillus subalutaceus]
MDIDDSDGIHGVIPAHELSADEEITLNIDDIRTEFHPHSEIPMQTQTFSTFQCDISQDPPIPNKQPWEPFQSRLDFDVAELAHKTALRKPQIERLINLLHRLKQESFTLHNHNDIHKTWNAMSHRLTPFQKQTIRVPYDGVDQEFTFHYQDLWDWACDLQDPYVGPQFTFNAQRLLKFDGQNFVRFIDEPWTATLFGMLSQPCLQMGSLLDSYYMQTK